MNAVQLANVECSRILLCVRSPQDRGVAIKVVSTWQRLQQKQKQLQSRAALARNLFARVTSVRASANASLDTTR